MSNGGKKKSQSSNTFHLFAGLASGFTSSILLQPADLLKTRVQQSGSTSLLSTLRQITSQPQPIRKLWRGTLPSCLRTSVGSALYFTTLNALRQNLAEREVLRRTLLGSTSTAKNNPSSSTLPQLSPLANLGCGAFARTSAGFVMMPITVIKVRYESSYYNYTSLLSAARDIGSREGLRGFFAGFGATAIRDAPYAGLYVVFYEQGKRVLSNLVTTSNTAASVAATTAAATAPAAGPSGGLGPIVTPPLTPLATPAAITPSTSALINFLSSTLAASTATAVTNPPDAIKTRLQLQPAKYRNTVQALKLMLKEEGPRSLFDGLALRMTRKALSSALAWTVYEEVIRRAEVRWAKVDVV